MAFLQVFLAKVIRSMDESNLNPAALKKLDSSTVLALRATKMMAQSISRSMANLVVLKHHLWLNIMEIKDADKIPFLDSPVSPTGLFVPAVEGFAKWFTATQKSSQDGADSAASKNRAPSCSASHQARDPPFMLSQTPPTEVPGTPAQDSAGPSTSGVFLIKGTGRGRGQVPLQPDYPSKSLYYVS